MRPMTNARPAPTVTVAVPLFNEEQSVEELLSRISAVLDELPGSGHEILCVDDGSTDGTLEILIRAGDSYAGLRVVSLTRNFGHQAALSAALEHANGDVVMVIDGDLQDDPGVLPQFIAEYEAGADVVFARRINRPEGFIRRVGYAAHYRLLSTISETSVQVDSGDFSLLSRRAVDLITALPERQRYLRGLRSWVGLTQVGIDVERQERYAGQSKYSLRDLAALAFEGVFAFSRVPLRVASVLGFLTVGAGVFYGGFVLVNRIAGGPPQGFATLALLQIGFSGMLLLVLGVIGEYVGRIYEEVKRRPLYLVDRIWESEDVGGRDPHRQVPGS